MYIHIKTQNGQAIWENQGHAETLNKISRAVQLETFYEVFTKAVLQMNKTASLGREPSLTRRGMQLDLFPTKPLLKRNVLHQHCWAFQRIKRSRCSNPLLTSATGIQAAQLSVAASATARVTPLTVLRQLGTKSSPAMLPSTGYGANRYIPHHTYAFYHSQQWRSQNLAPGYVHRVRKMWKGVGDAQHRAWSEQVNSPTWLCTLL